MSQKRVLTGIDVLIQDGFRQLAGSRVGLVTNHTGVASDGRSTVDVLNQTSDVTLTALFSPEHGIRGVRDEHVGDEKDAATGLPVYSLYGARTQPTLEQLDGIDTLVFDIQDIGCRFYTYISTLGNVMEAASEHGRRVVVLDRPNPIQGRVVEGPLADSESLSFVAYHPMPIRHGMTVGEIARLFQSECGFSCALEIVTCQNWHREDWYDATGLLWIDPSPNMRTLTAAALYPGVGLLEMTNVSVGRGTDRPFEVFGAPYLNARTFAGALNEACVPGVRCLPVEFTPRASVFAGTKCEGVSLILTDREALDSVRLGVTLATLLRDLYPTEFVSEKLQTLLVSQKAFGAFSSGASAGAIFEGWTTELSEFLPRRTRNLLYP